jgi:hypothetical protein
MIFYSCEDLAESLVSSPFCIVVNVYISDKWYGIACDQAKECCHSYRPESRNKSIVHSIC